MRKIASMILAIFMLLSNSHMVLANNNEGFYAYAENTEGYDTYAKNKIAGFIYGHFETIDSNYELGNGITIIQNDDYPKVLYPVWRNNRIIATFTVANINGMYSGTMSESRVSQLNQLRLVAENKPILLIGNQNGLFAKVDNLTYNLNEPEIGTISYAEFEDYSVANLNVRNVRECMDFDIPAIPRYPTSRYLTWVSYSTQASYKDGYCVSHCFYNIFKNNTQLTDYALNYIKAQLLLADVRYESMCDFLDEHDFTYNSQEGGCLGLQGVINAIYTKNNYVMILVKQQKDLPDDLGYRIEKFGHAMVLTGYNISASLGNTYRIWDPMKSTVLTMDADTNIVIRGETFSFKWNGGYFYNIVEV